MNQRLFVDIFIRNKRKINKYICWTYSIPELWHAVNTSQVFCMQRTLFHDTKARRKRMVRSNL